MNLPDQKPISPDPILRVVSENKLAVSRDDEPRPSFKLITTKKKRGEPADNLVHRSVYRGFAIEVWQKRETIGTAKPRYYSLRFDTSVKSRLPRASREDGGFYGFDSVSRALSRTEYLINKRRLILDDPSYQRRMLILKAQRSRPRTPIPYEKQIIDYLSGGLEPSLPNPIQYAIRERHGEHYG